MSDDIKDIKIGGISPSEYVRGIKNGNIDPTYDNGIKALLWAADEIERLLERRADAMSDDKNCGTCDYWEFGQRSYCSWKFFPGARAVSSAYKAGGECHAMAGSDGKDCPTWTKRKG